MTPLFQKILLSSLFPVFTMLVGGSIAIIKRPSANVRSIILHFAAGVVFAVVAVEILPIMIKTHRAWETIIGFTLGFITMAGLKKLLEIKSSREAEPAKNKIPMSLLLAIGIDIFIDGLLLGIGFAAGSEEGMLLAFALSIEFLSLGIATATELGENKIKPARAISVIFSLAGVFFISAVLGATLLHKLSDNVMELVLSFGLSALLYLVTEELLLEAHEEKETVVHSATFFCGFLIILIFGMTM
jgi:ZIP family zinc transporter